MVKIDVWQHIDELRNQKNCGNELDLYSLKKELNNLNENSKAFDNFEKNSGIIDKETLSQIQDLSILIKIRSLASEITNKKEIANKLHSLHFDINALKNASITSDFLSIRNMLNLFLHDNGAKIGSIIYELNDFKAKLDKLNNYYSILLPKSLDNKLKIEGKYAKHVKQLYSIHKRQKSALVSAIKLFLEFSKRHIKYLQKFKNNRQIRQSKTK